MCLLVSQGPSFREEVVGSCLVEEKRDRSAWANSWLVEWKSTTSSENQCQEKKNPQSYEPSLGYILFELARCDRYYPSDPYNLS